VRHAGARRATVELIASAAGARLRLTDDGAGFDGESVRAGLGLVSMRERVRLVGGDFVIDARPGAGTQIDVFLPFAPLVQSDRLGGGRNVVSRGRPPTQGLARRPGRRSSPATPGREGSTRLPPAAARLRPRPG